jgi:hypothetical protein
MPKRAKLQRCWGRKPEGSHSLENREDKPKDRVYKNGILFCTLGVLFFFTKMHGWQSDVVYEGPLFICTGYQNADLHVVL